MNKSVFPVPPISLAGKRENFHDTPHKRFRNFPNDAARGEHLLRKGYEEQMERLGVLVEDGGLVVDLGCGSGTSTRCAHRPARLPFRCVVLWVWICRCLLVARALDVVRVLTHCTSSSLFTRIVSCASFYFLMRRLRSAVCDVERETRWGTAAFIPALGPRVCRKKTS